MMRIYIVDDDKLIRSGLRAMIMRSIGNVEIVGEASSGKTALEEIAALLPDVVITDVKIPIINGVELTALITRMNKGIKTIVISGHDDYDYVRRSMKNGALDYLLKPIIKEELIAILKLIGARGESDSALSKELPNVIKSAQNYIQKHYAEKLTLEVVSSYVHLSPSYFSELFVTHVGMSFSAYTKEVRITHAKELLLGTQYKISTICEMVGYDVVSFSRAFKRITGISPAQYRKSHGIITDEE